MSDLSKIAEMHCELLAMQSVGQMVILKDRKSFLEELQERIKIEA